MAFTVNAGTHTASVGFDLQGGTDGGGSARPGADLVMSATAAMWDPLLALRWKSRQG